MNKPATANSAPTGSEVHKHQRMTLRQRLVVFLLLGAGFMLAVDFSILNVALPQVGSAVGLELSQFAWITSAFALPAAGFTLLFGRVADLFGRRRLFLAGIALMGLASVIGGLAMNPSMLLLARALQGFAVAMAMPASLSLLITSFNDDKQRARVLGFNGALRASGFTVGALVGGTVVGELSWRWAFLINVPVALAILAITPLVIQSVRIQPGARLDVPGAVSVTLGLLAVVFGVTDHSLYAVIAGLTLLIVFWHIEQRATAPLVAIGILTNPLVKWGTIAALIVYSMEPAFIFQMTIYLQKVMHLSPIATGVIFGIPGLAAILAGIVAGRLIGRYGFRGMLTMGLVAQGVFAAPMVFAGTGTLWVVILVPSLFLGFFGYITATVSCLVTATRGVANSQQGLATGLVSMSQQIGVTIGIPLLNAIATSQTNFLHGMHWAVLLNVAVTILGAAAISLGLKQSMAQMRATEVAATARV